MTSDPAFTEQLSEVLDLTNNLARRVLDAQEAHQLVADDQIRALVKAARLLQDHGIPWPPLLTHALQQVAGLDSEDAPRPAKPVTSSVLGELDRFLSGFRKEKGQTKP